MQNMEKVQEFIPIELYEPCMTGHPKLKIS